MIMLRTRYLLILLTCFSLPLLNIATLDTGIVNTAYASQKSTKDKILHDQAGKISGSVTDVITAAGFTYAEVDTGKEKVWAAGSGVTPLEKGDVIAFSTELPMKNYHSKTLGRDFSLIYFVKQFITDKETSAITTPHGEVKNQQTGKPATSTYVGTPGEVKKGEYLREATLNGLNGKSKKFSDFKGKPLLINVWASWCGPCRAEMDSLQRLANSYNGNEFTVIGISTDDYRNNAMDFIEQTGITFENYLDSKLLLENMLGANTIPLTILVDDQGRVLEKVRGAREWDNPEIIDAIAEVFHIKLQHQSR
jgi:thiol-disulfide isomerase/thioredoxin